MSGKRAAVDLWVLLGNIYGNYAAEVGFVVAQEQIEKFNAMFWPSIVSIMESDKGKLMEKVLADILANAKPPSHG